MIILSLVNSNHVWYIRVHSCTLTYTHIHTHTDARRDTISNTWSCLSPLLPQRTTPHLVVGTPVSPQRAACPVISALWELRRARCKPINYKFQPQTTPITDPPHWLIADKRWQQAGVPTLRLRQTPLPYSISLISQIDRIHFDDQRHRLNLCDPSLELLLFQAFFICSQHR